MLQWQGKNLSTLTQADELQLALSTDEGIDLTRAYVVPSKKEEPEVDIEQLTIEGTNVTGAVLLFAKACTIKITEGEIETDWTALDLEETPSAPEDPTVNESAIFDEVTTSEQITYSGTELKTYLQESGIVGNAIITDKDALAAIRKLNAQADLSTDEKLYAARLLALSLMHGITQIQQQQEQFDPLFSTLVTRVKTDNRYPAGLEEELLIVLQQHEILLVAEQINQLTRKLQRTKEERDTRPKRTELERIQHELQAAQEIVASTLKSQLENKALSEERHSALATLTALEELATKLATAAGTEAGGKAESTWTMSVSGAVSNLLPGFMKSQIKGEVAEKTEAIRQQIAACVAQIEGIVAAHQSLTATASADQSELGTTKKTLARSEQEKAHALAQVQELTATLERETARLQAELATLQKRTQERESELEQRLSEEAQQHAATVQKLEEQLSTERDKSSTLGTRLESETAQLQAQIEQQQAELARLTKLAGQQLDARKLQQAAQKARTANDQLRRIVKEQNSRADTAEARAAEAEKARQAAEVRNLDLQALLEEATHKNRVLEHQLQEAKKGAPQHTAANQNLGGKKGQRGGGKGGPHHQGANAERA